MCRLGYAREKSDVGLSRRSFFAKAGSRKGQKPEAGVSVVGKIVLRISIVVAESVQKLQYACATGLRPSGLQLVAFDDFAEIERVIIFERINRQKFGSQRGRINWRFVNYLAFEMDSRRFDYR